MGEPCILMTEDDGRHDFARDMGNRVILWRRRAGAILSGTEFTCSRSAVSGDPRPHPSPQVRALAANGLGRIGSAADSAQVALDGELKDPNAAVNRAAQSALERIGASPAGVAR